MVTRPDRLARSTRDLLNVLAALAEKDVQLRSLRDTWADPTTPHGRLMLTVLGGLAEFERELIRSRTGQGHERAKARGVKFGRRQCLTIAQRAFVAQQRANGESRAPFGAGSWRALANVSLGFLSGTDRAICDKQPADHVFQVFHILRLRPAASLREVLPVFDLHHGPQEICRRIDRVFG